MTTNGRIERFGSGLRWLVWGVYLLAWSAALLTPHPAMLTNRLFPDPLVRYLVHKSGHVVAYALLTILSGWLPLNGGWRWLLLACLSLHACGTEYLQNLVGRSGTLIDVGFNHLGILLGLMASMSAWTDKPKAE